MYMQIYIVAFDGERLYVIYAIIIMNRSLETCYFFLCIKKALMQPMLRQSISLTLGSTLSLHSDYLRLVS
jgi:hypothetical protein